MSEYTIALQSVEYLLNNDECLRDALTDAMNKQYLAMHKAVIWKDSRNGWGTKIDGKNVTCKTKEGLEKKIIEHYKTEFENYHFYDTLIEGLDAKLKNRKINRGTYDRYLNDYARYVKGTPLDKKSVSKVTRDDIKSFLNNRLAEGISKKNFNNLVSLLNIVYFFSEKNTINVVDVKKLMQISPKQFVSTNRRESTDIAWTDEEESALALYALEKNDIRGYAALLMLKTGLAVSEVVELTRSDIKLEEKTLTVHQIEVKQKVEGHTTRLVTTRLKTEERGQAILLTEEAIAILKIIFELSGAKKPDDRLFPELHTYDINNYFRRHIIPDLGLAQRGLHSLRKAYGTDLIDAQIPLKLVQEQMRHSDIKTTLEFYYKNKTTKAEALKLLNAMSSATSKAS